MSRKFFPRARRADSNNGKTVWQAKWIWCEGEPSPKNFYLHARRVFELRGGADRAMIRCTADSRYELYVNGHYVGRGPVRSDPRYQTYDTHDVTSLINRGKNAIALLIHHYGDSTYSYVPGRGGLICQVEIEQAGETTIIGTDEEWKVYPAGPWRSDGAKMSKRLGYQEVYDARLDLGVWTVVGYNDEKWKRPTVLGSPPVSPWENLIPRTIPQLREERILPVSIAATAALAAAPQNPYPIDVPALMASEEFLPLKNGDVTGEGELSVPNGHGVKLKGARSGGKSLLIDFGREVSGRVRIDLSGYEGGTVDIGYSEKLEEGRINPARSGVLYSDRLIMGGGRCMWTTFESRGFRYMQIDFRNISKPVHLHSVSVIETLYPVEHRGRFESSDELLNRIWAVGAETTRLCMEDSFTDCPWRERGEWWADARIESHAAYYAFGDTALLAQGLRHIARTQRKDGAVMCLYPVRDNRIIPSFAALWVMSVWEYYAFTGDRGMLFELYPAVTRLLGWLNKFTDQDGLLANVEGWNFIDWADIDTEGEVTALNCFFYKALRRAEHMALALGRGSDADRWNGLASILRVAINKHLWSPDRGLYADCRANSKLKDKFSRQTNILAVLYDVPDQYRKASICRKLLNGGLPEVSAPYFEGHFVDALFRMGYGAEAIDRIRRRWGAMIEAGATTFWEHFSPSDSLCHGWSVSPTRDLSAYVLGVQPVSGKRRVRIEPHIGDLRWAKGIVPTPFGEVEVEWRKGRRDFMMTICIPRGLSCELELPFAGTNAKISVNGREQEGSSFELTSGTHNVRVRSQPASGKPKETILDRNARETTVEYLSGYQVWRSPERRLRRRVHDGVAEAEPDEELVSDEEIEYVEGLDEIPPLLSGGLEGAARKKPARSRRRKPEAEVDIEKVEVAESPQLSESSQAVEAEMVEAALVEQTEPGKRRSRRGRRRPSRSRISEPAGTKAVETAVENVVEAAARAVVEMPAVDEAVAVDSATSAPNRRPRWRARRRKTPSRSENRPQAEALPGKPEVKSEESPTAEAAKAEPVVRRRRTYRRRRSVRFDTEDPRMAEES